MDVELGHPSVDSSLDDIFGIYPPKDDTVSQEAINSTQPETTVPNSSDELSDLPSLRRQHVTAGYRDGVSVSKMQHVQRGFDSGFPVGAQLGMRVGTILGILEGVMKGLDERTHPSIVKKQGTGNRIEELERTREARERDTEQVRRLYLAAVRELSVDSVFEAITNSPSTVNSNGDEKPEKQLAMRAESVVSKWEGIVAVPKWEEDMDVPEVEVIDEQG
jgi:hypothetical protein